MSDCPNNATLGNSISVLSGFPFPSAQFTEGIGKPLIRIRDLIGSRTETNFIGDFDPAFLIRHDDVLIGMDGDFNVVRWKGPEALLNQRVCKVSSASDEIDERFLFWWLKPHIQIVHHRTPQTTVRHLSVGDVYRIPKPPLASKAQAFAAAVLDTVDEAIAKTEAEIAKLRQVRAGLLHDLLTRGLDPHGQLRDPIAHPVQFQPSPLGQIPKEWEVKALESCVSAEITYGIVQAGPHIEGGVPYIRTGDMNGDCLVADQMLRTSPEIAARFRRSRVQTGEIVCAIRATVGKVLPVPAELDGANLTQGTARIAPKPDLHPTFLLWAIRGDRTQREIAREVKGTTFFEITLADLRRIKVAIPQDPDEQKHIAAAIQSMEAQLSTEAGSLAKLQSLKSGLMTDLLTGRVRVPAEIIVP